MELFSQKFFSIYFFAAIIMSILWMVTKIFKNRSINKTIKTLIQLPEDRKERIIRLYRRILLLHRIYLWTTPFTFLLLLAAFLLLSMFPGWTSAFPDMNLRQLLIMAGFLLAVVYIHFIEDSLYKKKILKAIDQS